jgi:hypothetical protein
MKKCLLEIIGNALKDLGIEDIPAIEVEVPPNDMPYVINQHLRR